MKKVYEHFKRYYLLWVDAFFILLMILICFPLDIGHILSSPKTNILFDDGYVVQVKYVQYLNGWKFDDRQDLQNPELPTGCEATAASTLLRMNGVKCTKLDVAVAMPKSGTDFVHHFLGDPYSNRGWACMAPCVVDTLKVFINENTQTAVELKDISLKDLPTPCEIWVTMYLSPVMYSSKTSESYRLTHNSHAIVLVKVDEERKVAICSDPLVGEIEYNIDKLSSVYDKMGRQAVYICNSIEYC